MFRPLLAACFLVGAAATAQPQPAAPAAPAPAAKETEEVKRDLEAKIEGARREIKEVREEVRAQLATQSASSDWQEEWVEQKRSLELFELDGYLRLRPDLFHKFHLGRAPGTELFPRSTTAPAGIATQTEHTLAGANMRLRLDPTLNVHEQVRIRMQVDILDNLVLGSTPAYAFSSGANDDLSLFSESQGAPRSGVNAIRDSLTVKRAWAQVTTPFGLLSFGRMASHWGVGMLRNDGNCLDCDFGTTVDRIQLVTEPLRGTGFYVTPMIDFNAEGITSDRIGEGGQPFDMSNTDDTHSFILAVAKRDTPKQEEGKLESGLPVLNYGLHLTYRFQRNDSSGYYSRSPYPGPGGELSEAERRSWRPYNATLVIPDVWAKYQRKAFRVEAELAAVLGNITNRNAVNDPLLPANTTVAQFGGVLQTELSLVNGDLTLGLELGFASGDRTPGLNADLRTFAFNSDYRIDLILFREILGTVNNAFYARPTLDYRIAEGFHLFGAIIYSRALVREATPHGGQADLGVELNAGAKFETADGFMAGLQWAILFPLAGLNEPAPQNTNLETAQAIRAYLGIRF